MEAERRSRKGFFQGDDLVVSIIITSSFGKRKNCPTIDSEIRNDLFDSVARQIVGLAGSIPAEFIAAFNRFFYLEERSTIPEDTSSVVNYLTSRQKISPSTILVVVYFLEPSSFADKDH